MIEVHGRFNSGMPHGLAQVKQAFLESFTGKPINVKSGVVMSEYICCCPRIVVCIPDSMEHSMEPIVTQILIVMIREEAFPAWHDFLHFIVVLYHEFQSICM